jgi:DNA-binding transcriptional LysR family regulator
MEHRQLLHFLAACEEKSFSGAAKRCYISPQGLSISIGQLEKELKVPLFFRTPQGIEITEYGRALKRAASSYTNYHDQIISEMRNIKLKITSSVSVAFIEGTYVYFPSGFFKNFMLKYPYIDLDIFCLPSDICQASMSEHNISVGFVEPPINTNLFDSICKNRYKVHLVAGKEHPLANRSSIKLAELRNCKVCVLNNHQHPQNIITELCACEGVKLSIALGNSDMGLYNELFSTGRIVSFWAGPMDSIPDLVKIDIDEFESLYHESHFIVNQSVHLTDAARKFIYYTKEQLGARPFF